MRRFAPLALALTACAATPPPVPEVPRLERVPSVAAERPAPEAPPERVVLSVVGINDVHGHLERLPHLAGAVANLRRRRAADGGAVLVIDAGDMWQGTLASNLDEGASMVRAYETLRVDAAALGNHEFDYGPVGSAATPQGPDDDPRGALLARIAEADFPILGANFLDAESGEWVAWPGLERAVLLERAGVKIGVIGVSTAETLRTTIRANVADLEMAPLASTIEVLARELREDGAQVVVVAAHAGARCEAFDDPRDLSSCELDEEIVHVARALPEGLVDVIVAGHTHRAIAHFVGDVAVTESWAYGRAFGRVDLVLEGGEVRRRIFPPHDLCTDRDADYLRCEAPAYAGAPVEAEPAMVRTIEPALEAARAQREAPLGVTLEAPFARSRQVESPLGNLLVDLLAELDPQADVALLNGGGVRADLDAGPLTYGALYEAFPFDNRLARVTLTGAELRAIVAANLGSESGTLIFAGVRVRARCEAGVLRVELRDRRGRPIRDRARLELLTTDYLATTSLFTGVVSPDAVRVEDGPPLREGLAERLRARGGALRPTDFLDERAPRVDLPGRRPLRCAP
ncbi:MAG TPA: bifunctional UDP-sugar hydrolase/5'-nucleotidase [Polyangiaceae bacterium LLY-WYZ-15_(1-7)]|nr:bifunctional metallophosphatase/5'-nucleotidase [Sandaracinus sp.]HJL05117.1 bifunctional UDP-sugar hydrolase/5'-nucleotidase [Polyangiaceae bacterium LLY-WYZ-15_(1-7)]MBJ73280.1 bifunctional metallophosphatase/5'-nucleotidase [Sandaracinus sp.]HJL09858.1 bifunctional UDP-sugar hydrolase/5'-nucleotidase [Polyangiaceae bacterium LLY-WYZ-15_(1-7)]HJL27273.1 bifunctional UDP-sugar hydrolase/5'-nucleotidase [Polyangiaceae bacterium LLY-WYZ-15_(1-7)]